MKKSILALAAVIGFGVQADWSHVENIDLMTDNDRSLIFGTNNSRRAALVVRCDGKGDFDIFARFEYLGDRYTSVIVRFDNNEPVTLRASADTDGLARFFSGSSKSVMLDGLRRSKRVVLRATDFRGTPKTEVYDLTGFNDEASKLACLPRQG